MNKIRKLLESILSEAIADVKKYYPEIDDNKFIELIKLDPTYQEGRNSVGNYGKWILNLYKKGLLKDEDFYKVTDNLTEFQENRKKFQNKDINQFKSLPDLAQALEGIRDEDVELSKRQELRQMKKQGVKDADLVFEDENWKVYIPRTYEASCNLGSGTSWCTATTRTDDYYKRYSSNGKLYILISEHDPKDKYQFHFETNSFMDRYDDPVELTVFLKENSGLHKFFQPIIDEKIESNPSLFVLLSNPTEEQIAEGMRVGTNYNFEYKEGRGVVQEVSLYKLLAEGDLDDEVRTFLEELYEGDSTVKSDAWTAIIKNEKIRSFIEKYITENDEEVEALKEETIPAFLRDYHKDIYGDIEDKMVEYGNLPEETINKVEDIIGYKIEDIKHGHIFIDFDYWGEVDAIGSDISNLNYMAEDNIRNYSIYIQDEEDENYIKNLANTYKDQLEDEDDFLADVKRILIKHKHSLTDKRNNQIKLNLGNEEE